MGAWNPLPERCRSIICEKIGKCWKFFLGALFITLDNFITNSNFSTLIAPMDRYLDAASIIAPIAVKIISP